MSEFSATGEAKVLTKLVEARLDPNQTAAEKAVEENAIQRELDGMTPQQLREALTEFNKKNTGMCKWTEIQAREVHPDAEIIYPTGKRDFDKEGVADRLYGPTAGVKFNPLGYYGFAESFSVKQSNTPGSIDWLTESGKHSELLK